MQQKLRLCYNIVGFQIFPNRKTIKKAIKESSNLDTICRPYAFEACFIFGAISNTILAGRFPVVFS